jgi:hypothetical protein
LFGRIVAPLVLFIDPMHGLRSIKRKRDAGSKGRADPAVDKWGQYPKSLNAKHGLSRFWWTTLLVQTNGLVSSRATAREPPPEAARGPIRRSSAVRVIGVGWEPLPSP